MNVYDLVVLYTMSAIYSKVTAIGMTYFLLELHTHLATGWKDNLRRVPLRMGESPRMS